MDTQGFLDWVKKCIYMLFIRDIPKRQFLKVMGSKKISQVNANPKEAGVSIIPDEILFTTSKHN